MASAPSPPIHRRAGPSSLRDVTPATFSRHGVDPTRLAVLLIGMTCCPGNLMSKFPLNIILLMVFSLFQGVALGVIAASYACDARAYDPAKGLVVCVNNPDAPAVNGRMSVLLAMAITIGVVLVLTIFACQTKYDFTGAGPYLMAALLIFIVFFAIAGIWLRFDKVYNLVYEVCLSVDLKDKILQRVILVSYLIVYLVLIL